MTATTWILVSDASRAKLFEGQRREIREFADYLHPESREHTDQLISSEAGRRGQRTHGASGDGARPGLSEAVPPKEAEAASFARELAVHLKQGLNAHRYGSLVLVAPPHFLGLLKAALDPHVRKALVSAHAHNYIELDPHPLIRKLESLLQEKP